MFCPCIATLFVCRFLGPFYFGSAGFLVVCLSSVGLVVFRRGFGVGAGFFLDLWAFFVCVGFGHCVARFFVLVRVVLFGFGVLCSGVGFSGCRCASCQFLGWLFAFCSAVVFFFGVCWVCFCSGLVIFCVACSWSGCPVFAVVFGGFGFCVIAVVRFPRRTISSGVLSACWFWGVSGVRGVIGFIVMCVFLSEFCS